MVQQGIGLVSTSGPTLVGERFEKIHHLRSKLSKTPRWLWVSLAVSDKHCQTPYRLIRAFQQREALLSSRNTHCCVRYRLLKL
jgi:hypothetical protein